MNFTRLLCFIAIAALPFAMAHFQDPRINTFPIAIHEQGSQSVTLDVKGDKATCTFKFRTNPEAQARDAPRKEEEEKPEVPVEEAKSVSLTQVVGGLQGTCIQKRLGYWNYELCFGGMVKQYHDSDVYVLGRHGEVSDNLYLFADGDMCEALDPPRPRKLGVSFACQADARGPTLLTVTEVGTCEYSVQVATAAVCGDPNFSVVETSSFPSAVEAVVDDGSEDWYMEITHLDDGRASCAVYSTELRSMGSKLNFHEFDLQLKAGDSIAKSDDPFPYFTARHPGRVPCAPDEVNVEVGRITDASSFDGKLAFLKVVT